MWRLWFMPYFKNHLRAKVPSFRHSFVQAYTHLSTVNFFSPLLVSDEIYEIDEAKGSKQKDEEWIRTTLHRKWISTYLYIFVCLCVHLSASSEQNITHKFEVERDDSPARETCTKRRIRKRKHDFPYCEILYIIIFIAGAKIERWMTHQIER